MTRETRVYDAIGRLMDLERRRTIREVRKGIESLEQPTLGLKGGVSRAEVLALLDRLEPKR